MTAELKVVSNNNPFKKNELKNPPKIILYGVQGIGKTTIAANTPNPVFIKTEDGLGALDVASGELCTTYDQFKSQLQWLVDNDHDFKTVVIDSLDWLERLIHNEIAQKAGVYDISAISYGKGFDMAAREWQKIVDRLTLLNQTKGMVVFALAHSQIKRHEPPDSDPYDRYTLDLNKRASAVLSEWCDCLFFLNYDVKVTKSESSFGNVKTKATGTNDRIIYTSEKPAFVAKNRFGLPAEMRIETDESHLFWSNLRDSIKK